MSEQTEWQKWCAETAPVIAAAGRGEVVQWLDDGLWIDKPETSSFCSHTKYRIKPRTIRIGEYDVPEPMREAPEVGALFWTFNVLGDVYALKWEPNSCYCSLLNSGLCHYEMRAAELHAKALISLTAKKD